MAGSYSSTVPTDRCGRCGCTPDPLAPGVEPRAADHVDLVAHSPPPWASRVWWATARAASMYPWQDRIPTRCRSAPTPPGRTAAILEAAERVDLPAVLGKGNVVRQQRHRLFLRPFVGGRIVFVDHADRLPAGSEPAEHVHLAARPRCRKALPRARETARASHTSARAPCRRRKGPTTLLQNTSVAILQTKTLNLPQLLIRTDLCEAGRAFHRHAGCPATGATQPASYAGS